MTRTIEQVDKLQEELGDYHDCVIAQDRLRNGLDIEVSSLVVKRP